MLVCEKESERKPESEREKQKGEKKGEGERRDPKETLIWRGTENPHDGGSERGGGAEGHALRVDVYKLARGFR